jgi:hypothetical protein
MKGTNVALGSLSAIRRAPAPAVEAPAPPPEAYVPTPREERILRVMENGAPMTDREICVALKQHDLNYVRPFITRMLERGIIRQHADRRCLVTGKTVRTTFREDRA